MKLYGQCSLHGAKALVRLGNEHDSDIQIFNTGSVTMLSQR